MPRSTSAKKRAEESFPNMVLRLDHAAGIGAGGDMTKANIVQERAKEGNTLSDEYRQSTDDQTVDESGAQKLLNRNSTVHIQTVGTGRSQFGHNLRRGPLQLLNDTSARTRRR